MEITVNNLSVIYKSTIAVNNVSFKLRSGKIYGIIGANGAGKSSLIKSIVGVLSNYNGEIIYNKMSSRKDRFEIKKILGYAPEDVQLIPYLTGYEYLRMIADLRKIKNAGHQIEELIDLLGLTEVSKNLIISYSHGMMQKISLAGSIIGSPKVIILDEALNGFDPVAMYRVKEYIKQLVNHDHLIIISSHVLEIVEQWCDDILMMHKGIILEQYNQQQLKKIKSETGKNLGDLFMELIRGYKEK